MVYPAAGIAVSTGSAWGTSLTDNSTNWTTGYTERRQWDGGATNLVASTGRTSLGATTVGSNLFTLANPSAVRFLRTNSDNSISARTAAELKTDLSLTAADVGLGNVTNESKATMFSSPTFTGTVTMPSPFTLGGTSVTTTGARLNYLTAATGTTGTGNLVFSASPTFTGTVTGTFSGNLTGNVTGDVTGNAGTVTGFTRNSGTLTLSGGHGLTLSTTATTSLTLPTSGAVATTTDVEDIMDDYLAAATVGISLADSTGAVGKAQGSYVTGKDWDYGNSAAQLRAFQALGSTIKALPIYGYNPTVGHSLSDATALLLSFYIPKTIEVTGVGWAQLIQGDYTAADYNGFALYSVSGTTYNLEASTTDDGNIWKATAMTLQTKAFASGPISVSPGAYYLVLFYNQSAQVTAPQIFHSPNIYNAILTGITGTNKLSMLRYTTTSVPSSITAASCNTLVEPPVLWLY